ncbi:MAG: c-type cytochrome [Planctomycetes bacterium]|nr:c-type cytochrome [Planctomycetota bacterium]
MHCLRLWPRIAWIALPLLISAACGEKPAPLPPPKPAAAPQEQEFEPEKLKLPADPASYAPVERYEPMKIPGDNPMTQDKATLGWQLFFDKRLSGDGKLSCYSCHVNEHGLTDGKALGEGAFGKPLTRSSPTLWNIGYHAEFYWDGRAKSLEAQAMAAWKGVNMGANPEEVVKKLNALPGYRKQFRNVFQKDATPESVTLALACYMRTIISRDTPFDRWQRGDEKAVGEAAKRGYEAFKKAKCDNCHSGVFFTDLQFHNVGIGMKREKPDVGRFTVSNRKEDTGAFKTPTLRDIADSGPYFHDGSVATLEEAVRLMVDGGVENEHFDRVNLKKADLTESEFRDLMEFFKSLDEPATLKEPKLPPESRSSRK